LACRKIVGRHPSAAANSARLIVMSPADKPLRPAPFRRALLLWYRRVGRDLPWRKNRSAWRVWVSEMMLQQTTVATVLPRYESFLRDFPSIRAMAEAPLESVLASWSGLGYYTRARNLHAATNVVMATHGGRFPEDRKSVRALPGFGDYSTAAILSIVHGQPLAVVDGNVIRVIARLQRLPGHAKSTALKREVQAVADRLIDPGEPGDFNQAIMELGATVCTPTSPRCGECPVVRFCMAHRQGVVAAHPSAAPKKPMRDERWQVAIIESKGRILMRQRPETERLMPGLWELPAWESKDDDEIAALLCHDISPQVRLAKRVGRARHAIMNRRMELIVHRAEMTRGTTPTGWTWIKAEEVSRLPVSSMVMKALRAAFGVAADVGAAGGKTAGSGGVRGKAAGWQARRLLGGALILGVLGSGLAAIAAEPEIAPTRIAPADSVMAGSAPADTAAIVAAHTIITPELAARTVTGESISLHQMLGRGPVLVNFWALWCKPCLKELPELQKLQEQFSARGFTVLSINGDSPVDVAKVAPFVRSRKLMFPVLTDLDGNLRRRFQANAFPTSILLDRSGRVAWTSQGYRPGDDVEMAKQIEGLLKGAGGAGE